jgi:hypothetical protein
MFVETMDDHITGVWPAKTVRSAAATASRAGASALWITPTDKTPSSADDKFVEAS